MDRLDKVRIGNSSIHNKGLFARNSFNVGDSILTEQPLIICSYSSDKRFFNLIELSSIIAAIPKSTIDLITKLYLPRNQFFSIKAQSLIKQNKSKLNTNVSISLLTKIITILLVNGLTIRIQKEQDKDIIIGSGLFYTVSHCNHSCLPNTEWCTIKTNDNKIKIVLKAVQDINKDDEIFISYFSHTHSYRNTLFRQLYLKNGWNFDCKCKRCKNKVDDVRRFKSKHNSNQYYCAPNHFHKNESEHKMDDEQILAEKKFLKSKLWQDINNCDLSHYGDEYKQLQMIRNIISELNLSGLHSSHYLFLELSYPLAAITNNCIGYHNKSEILSILLDRSVLMKKLIKQPNVRLLENELEIIEFAKRYSNDTKFLRIKMDHIIIALKLSYILYPMDEHQCIHYLKSELLKIEKCFIKKKISLQFECNICWICQKEGVRNRCSRCQKVYYCSVAHQKHHWKIHKLACNKIKH